MMDIVTQALTNLLIVLLNVGIGYLVAFLRKHKVLAEFYSVHGLVQIAVKGVEQSLSSNKGEEKFKLAKDWIINTAKEKGLNVSENQIDLMIESVVKDVKGQFGEVIKAEEVKQ